jgi:hypothetical protein
MALMQMVIVLRDRLVGKGASLSGFRGEVESSRLVADRAEAARVFLSFEKTF